MMAGGNRVNVRLRKEENLTEMKTQLFFMTTDNFDAH